MAALRKPTSTNAENRQTLARACLLNAALPRISARWKMQVLHAVHGGITTYGALKHRLPGVSHQVLSTRLRELVDEELLARGAAPSDPAAIPRVSYRNCPPCRQSVRSGSSEAAGRCTCCTTCSSSRAACPSCAV
jgi:DNA-binding HxlR family transcriptional regulator